MTGEQKLVADTYAFIELIEGNEQYGKLVEHFWLTTEHALVELTYYVLRTGGPGKALHYYNKYKHRITPLSERGTVQAMLFRLRNKHEKLSYTDCLGYALAMELGIPFLTGDKKFKAKKNVRFVT